MESVATLVHVRSRSVAFAERHGLQFFYSRVRYDHPRYGMVYQSCMITPEGHPFITLQTPALELGERFFGELSFTAPDGVLYGAEFELSPSQLFWFVIWAPLDFDWLWGFLDVRELGGG